MKTVSFLIGILISTAAYSQEFLNTRLTLVGKIACKAPVHHVCDIEDHCVDSCETLADFNINTAQLRAFIPKNSTVSSELLITNHRPYMVLTVHLDEVINSFNYEYIKSDDPQTLKLKRLPAGTFSLTQAEICIDNGGPCQSRLTVHSVDFDNPIVSEYYDFHLNSIMNVKAKKFIIDHLTVFTYWNKQTNLVALDEKVNVESSLLYKDYPQLLFRYVGPDNIGNGTNVSYGSQQMKELLENHFNSFKCDFSRNTVSIILDNDSSVTRNRDGAHDHKQLTTTYTKGSQIKNVLQKLSCDLKINPVFPLILE